MSLDGVDSARAAAADASDHIVGVSANGAPCEFGGVRQTRRHPLAVQLDRLDHRILRCLNPFDQIIAPLAQPGQQAVADRLETVVHVADPRDDVAGRLLARAGEAFGHRFADRRDRYAHPRALGDDALEGRGARAVHRGGDVVRRPAERGRQSLASFRKPLAQGPAGDVEVRRDAFVSRRDRVADPRSAGRDQLAMIGHFRDQQADLALVVGIGGARASRPRTARGSRAQRLARARARRHPPSR